MLYPVKIKPQITVSITETMKQGMVRCTSVVLCGALPPTLSISFMEPSRCARSDIAHILVSPLESSRDCALPTAHPYGSTDEVKKRGTAYRKKAHRFFSTAEADTIFYFRNQRNVGFPNGRSFIFSSGLKKKLPSLHMEFLFATKQYTAQPTLKQQCSCSPALFL